LPFLDDFEEDVRVAAAQQLAKIGDLETANKIEEVLKRRAQGLRPDQIAKDRSFQTGYAAINTLRLKKFSSPPQTGKPRVDG
jgi:HEAT repeat protein